MDRAFRFMAWRFAAFFLGSLGIWGGVSAVFVTLGVRTAGALGSMGSSDAAPMDPVLPESPVVFGEGAVHCIPRVSPTTERAAASPRTPGRRSSRHSGEWSSEAVASTRAGQPPWHSPAEQAPHP